MHTGSKLFNALMLDCWPEGMATLVDYGLDKADRQDVYAAMQRKVRSGEVTETQLIAACGKGPELTRLFGIEISTSWDDLPLEEDYDDEEVEIEQVPYVPDEPNEPDPTKHKAMVIQSKTTGKWNYSLMHPAMVLSLEYSDEGGFDSQAEAILDAHKMWNMTLANTDWYVKESTSQE